jgi:MFS family permease
VGERSVRMSHRPATASYRELLGNREFTGLMIAQVLSECGDQIARVGLAVLVLTRTDNPFLAALAFVVSYVPAIFGAALLAPFADRVSRRSVMLAADAGRALLIGVLALLAVPSTPIWLMFVLLFLAELLSAPFEAARAAVLPDVLIDPRHYLRGAGLSRVLSQVDQVLGLALAGIIVALISPRGALVVDAVTFALSFVVVLLSLHRRPAALQSRAGLAGYVHDLQRGAALVARNPPRRCLVLFAWGAAAFTIAPEAVALAYAEAGGNPAALGTLLMATLPAGGALGAILVGRWAPEDQTRAILPLALASCLPLLLTGASPPVFVAAALWFAAGVGQGFMVPLIATVNLLTPADSRGRVNGLAAAGFNVASASAFALAGLGAAVMSPAAMVLLAGVAGILVCAVAWTRWPRAALAGAVAPTG